jgi:hypothetical protein
MRHFPCFKACWPIAIRSGAIISLLVAVHCRTASAGETPYGIVWANQTGTSGTDVAYALTRDDEGGLYVGGYTTGSWGSAGTGGESVVVVKYSSIGDVEWVGQIPVLGGGNAKAIAFDAAGSVYAGGDTNGDLGGPSAGAADAFVVKYSADGQLLWARQFGTSTEDRANAVAVDAVGNVFVAGFTAGSLAAPLLGSRDIVIAKYSTSGDLLWIRQIGSSGRDYGMALAANSNGDVFLAGEVLNGNLGGRPLGGYDAYVGRISSEGEVLWIRQFGTSTSEAARAVVVDENDDVFVAGWTYGDLAAKNAGQEDLYVAKFSSAGDALWAQQTGSSEIDRCFSAALDSTGNIFVSGYRAHFPAVTEIDGLLARFSPQSYVPWTTHFATNALDVGYGLVVDDADDVIVTGVTGGELGGPFLGGNGDVFLAKFAPALMLGDITGDGSVNADDVLAVIVDWGQCLPPPADCPADIAPHPAGNQAVDSDDLIMVIVNWDE